MADVITRFKLETTQYDSKLRDASKTLSEFARQVSFAGKDFDKFTKGNVEAARAFGNISTSATNAKDKVKELVGAYNDMARSYNMLSKEQQQSDWAKAMAQSMQTLKGRISEAKKEMQELQNVTKSATAGGGLFSGDKLSGMLQVWGGNLMTKATGMAVGAVTDFANELGDAVKQGIELAKQGEGIRISFERLGRGDILQGLREATHGTVTDLELMKAAVKFNDFKLPVEELGTMLAFAQQKAKDTGQSVDYMVDSIVTGLGRKSLMILDNLGLSAAEIKEKMKDTGDMTKAVGEIIREQMAKAGDYVETAADRAAQANVELQNKMEELGRKFAPIEEASTQLWTSMKIGILDIISGPLMKLIGQFNEAIRLKNQLNEMTGGDDGTGSNETQKQLEFLRKTSAGNRQARYNKQVGIYTQKETDSWRNYNAIDAQYRDYIKNNATWSTGAKALAGARDKAKLEAEAWQTLRVNYQQRAQPLLTSNKPLPPSSDTTNTVIPTKTGTGDKTTVKELTEVEKLQQQINDLVQQGMTMDEQGRAAQRVKIATLQDQLQTYKDIENELRGIGKKETEIKPIKPVETAMSKFEGGPTNVQSMQAYLSAMQGEMQKFDLGSEFYKTFDAKLREGNTLSQILQQAMESGVQGANLENVAQTIKDKMLQGGVMNTEQIKALVDEINTSIEDNGLKLKLEIDEKGAVTGVTTQVAEMTKNWKAAGTAISQVGAAMSQIEDPAAKVAGTIAQAIATVALAFAQALQKPKDPWSWIAFAAAGTATMISTIAAIHSATGYAEGGIIKGNTYSGDNIMANGGNIGLNAGELVLNRAQQGVLAAELESGNRGNGAPTHPYVSGEMIFLGLNNYLRRTGRGEIVTSR